MLKLFIHDKTQDRIEACTPSSAVNQAITHSMIQADAALNKARFSDAQKFYRYALQLSEMHFGENDSVVNNLRSLLKALDALINDSPKTQVVCTQRQSFN